MKLGREPRVNLGGWPMEGADVEGGCCCCCSGGEVSSAWSKAEARFILGDALGLDPGCGGSSSATPVTWGDCGEPEGASVPSWGGRGCCMKESMSGPKSATKLIERDAADVALLDLRVAERIPLRCSMIYGIQRCFLSPSRHPHATHSFSQFVCKFRDIAIHEASTVKGRRG